MRRLGTWNIANRYNRSTLLISYRLAFAISLALHGLALSVVGFFLSPRDISDSETPALVFDLRTTDNIHRHVADPASEQVDQNSSLRNKAKVASLFTRGPSVARVPVTSNEDSMEDGYEIRDPLEHTAAQLSQSQNLALTAMAFPTALLQRTMAFPRHNPSELKLALPKLPVSHQHQHQLKKAIKKVMDRLIELDQADTTLCFAHGSQLFTVTVHRILPQDPVDLETAVVDVETQNGDQQLTTRVRLRRLAFSHFAQLVDHWDSQVAIHNDVLEGRFHSNYPFVLSRSAGVIPRFHGKVTTAAYDFKLSDHFPWFDRHAIFQAGIETGVEPIRFPSDLLPSLAQSNSYPLLRFKEECWVTFHADGSIQYRSKSAGAAMRRLDDHSQVFFILGDLGAKIHVRGTVKGKILVYSKGNIIIDGDLLYARPPERFSDSGDLLGLVSEKNIEIAHPSITGQGDLTICAAIYARGWFRIPNLTGSGEAKLRIYGSLSAGCLSATEPRYATHVRFDPRFERQRPPFFPSTDHFEIAEWSKEWEIAPNIP